VLLDGFSGCGVAKELGLKELWPQVVQLDATQAKAAILKCNQRGRVCEIEEAWIVRSLIREQGLRKFRSELLDETSPGCAARLRLAGPSIRPYRMICVWGCVGDGGPGAGAVAAGNQARAAEAVREHQLTCRRARSRRAATRDGRSVGGARGAGGPCATSPPRPPVLRGAIPRLSDGGTGCGAAGELWRPERSLTRKLCRYAARGTASGRRRGCLGRYRASDRLRSAGQRAARGGWPPPVACALRSRPRMMREVRRVWPTRRSGASNRGVAALDQPRLASIAHRAQVLEDSLARRQNRRVGARARGTPAAGCAGPPSSMRSPSRSSLAGMYEDLTAVRLHEIRGGGLHRPYRSCADICAACAKRTPEAGLSRWSRRLPDTGAVRLVALCAAGLRAEVQLWGCS